MLTFAAEKYKDNETPVVREVYSLKFLTESK